MSFEQWYRTKPKWLKVILSVILALGVVLSAIWWLVTRSTIPRPGPKPGPLQAVTDALEDEYKKDVQKTVEAVERNDEKIKKLKEQRAELEKKRVDGMKQNEDEHEAIDSASDAASVVAAINANRRRRRPTETD